MITRQKTMNRNSRPDRQPCGVAQPRWLLPCIVALLLSGASIRVGLGQEFGHGAALLKETDRVLIGRILRRGDFYEIELGPDSRVSIPTEKVAHVAGSLLELYQFKRSKISQRSIGDHFQLTRWCLSNGLLFQAAEHYSVVQQRNPNHPRVKQLGVELEEQLLRDEDFRRHLGLAPLSTVASDAQPIRIAAKNVGDSKNVVTASAFDGGGTWGLEAGHPQVVQRFTQRVEPILLSRCSQAACHGVQSNNGLRLLEPYGRTHARTTSENLASVLKHIEGSSVAGAQVGDSADGQVPLLQYATRAHGIQPAPAIPFTETQLLQELRDWIDFAHQPVVAAVASGPSPNSNSVATSDQANFAAGAVPLPFPGTGLNPVVPGGVPRQSSGWQSSGWQSSGWQSSGRQSKAWPIDGGRCVYPVPCQRLSRRSAPPYPGRIRCPGSSAQGHFGRSSRCRRRFGPRRSVRSKRVQSQNSQPTLAGIDRPTKIGAD